MNACQRAEAPELLARFGPEIGREYAERRAQNSACRFHWPKRLGRSLFETARSALSEMTEGHCAYCDGHPLDATGEEQIDHFRPKSRSEFYELVCVWKNLFLCCHACNKAKREQWDDALLRPDAEDFSFLRYFSFRTDTGELEPNLAASLQDQHRAQFTIEILNLNRSGLCTLRRKALREFLTGAAEPDAAYRFLRSLVE